MPKSHVAKSLNALLEAAFACAMVMACGGCNKTPENAASVQTQIEAPQNQDNTPEVIETPDEHIYVATEMAKVGVDVPPSLANDEVASSTYKYMGLAAVAVAICTDARHFETGTADEQAHAKELGGDGFLGPEIFEYINGLPKKNVDPVAIQATTLLSNNFDQINDYNTAAQAAVLNEKIAWATAAIDIFSGASTGGVVDPDKFGDQFVSKMGAGDEVVVRDAATNYAKMFNLASQTRDNLARLQGVLSAKYHVSFPAIPLNANYTSNCNLPWYL